MGYKVLFELSDGTKVWINLQQIVKMIKTPDSK